MKCGICGRPDTLARLCPLCRAALFGQLPKVGREERAEVAPQARRLCEQRFKLRLFHAGMLRRATSADV